MRTFFHSRRELLLQEKILSWNCVLGLFFIIVRCFYDSLPRPGKDSVRASMYDIIYTFFFFVFFSGCTEWMANPSGRWMQKPATGKSAFSWLLCEGGTEPYFTGPSEKCCVRVTITRRHQSPVRFCGVLWASNHLPFHTDSPHSHGHTHTNSYTCTHSYTCMPWILRSYFSRFILMDALGAPLLLPMVSPISLLCCVFLETLLVSGLLSPVSRLPSPVSCLWSLVPGL